MMGVSLRSSSAAWALVPGAFICVLRRASSIVRCELPQCMLSDDERQIKSGRHCERGLALARSFVGTRTRRVGTEAYPYTVRASISPSGGGVRTQRVGTEAHRHDAER